MKTMGVSSKTTKTMGVKTMAVSPNIPTFTPFAQHRHRFRFIPLARAHKTSYFPDKYSALFERSEFAQTRKMAGFMG